VDPEIATRWVPLIDIHFRGLTNLKKEATEELDRWVVNSEPMDTETYYSKRPKISTPAPTLGLLSVNTLVPPSSSFPAAVAAPAAAGAAGSTMGGGVFLEPAALEAFLLDYYKKHGTPALITMDQALARYNTKKQQSKLFQNISIKNNIELSVVLRIAAGHAAKAALSPSTPFVAAQGLVPNSNFGGTVPHFPPFGTAPAPGPPCGAPVPLSLSPFGAPASAQFFGAPAPGGWGPSGPGGRR
jgi:hypothetical protein